MTCQACQNKKDGSWFCASCTKAHNPQKPPTHQALFILCQDLDQLGAVEFHKRLAQIGQYVKLNR